MATAGTLNLVLSADSSQLRNELGRVQKESQSAALAIANLFSGETINAVGLRVLKTTVVGVISDIDEMNEGLSLSESLTRNLAAGFEDLGDIALLQLGQIAQFLGDDLFQNPLLGGAQSAALERTGLGQLEGAFQIVTAGITVAKAAQPVLEGIRLGFSAIDGVLGQLQGNARFVSDFFASVATNARLVGLTIVGAADLIDGAIADVIDTLAEINPAFKLARDGAKELGLEFSVGRALFGDYIDDISRIEATASGTSEAFGQISDGAESARGGLKFAGDSIDTFGDRLIRQKKSAELFKEGMEDLADAAFLFDGWVQASEVFDGFFGSLEEVFNAAKEAENLANRLQTTSKSARGAGDDLDFLNQITDELGLNFNATAEGYAQFSAAAQRSNYDAAQTRQIFEDVAQSASVMRLSMADTEGIFFALRQSLSGGNVELEELNQLAERIPGAFQAAEDALRSMGYSAGSVRDIVKTGTVDAEQFVAAFSQQLGAQSNSGVVGAANSAEAALNRFNNALGELQVEMGRTWLEIGTPALNVFADALSFAAKNEELFSTSIDALLVAAAVRGTGAIITFTRAIFTGGQTINFFGKQINLTAKQIGGFALQSVLAYGATILFYRSLERTRDQAQSTREAIASLDKSLADYKDNAEGVESPNFLPDGPPPRDWFDVAVNGLKEMREEGNLAQKAIASAVDLTVVGIGTSTNRLVNYLKTGRNEIVTFGEKALNDQLSSLGDFAIRAQEILGESINIRFAAQQGSGPIAELKEIDLQLQQLEKRKLGADPTDLKLVEELTARETELLERRKEAQSQVQAAQSALNNALAQAQTQLQNLDPSELGAQGYAEAKQRLEQQIAQIEEEKSKFDELANSAVNAAQVIADSFKESSQTLEESFSAQQVAIAEALAAGRVSEEEAQQQRLDTERDYLDDRIRLNTQKAAELKTALENNAKLEAIDPGSGFLSPEEIESYQSQILQLEEETSQSRIQLAQTVVDERKRQEEEIVKAFEEALAKVERASEQAGQAIAQSQNQRILGIRQAERAGVKSAEDAAAEISAIEQDAIAQSIAAKQTELSQIQTLRNQQGADIEELAAREAQLTTEIGSLKLDQIQKEIEARRAAAEEALQQQFAPIQLALNTEGDNLDLRRTGLQGELDLLNAQAELQQSLAELDIQRSESALAYLESIGDTAKAEELRAEIIEKQRRQLDAQFDAQAEQLELQQEIQSIELERALITAQIAESEAEIALLRAEQENASEREIANLQRILQLRQAQVGQAETSISQQGELNEIERDNLGTQREIAQERLYQSSIQEKQNEQQREQNQLVQTLSEQQDEMSKQEIDERLKQIRQRARLAEEAGLIDSNTLEQLEDGISAARRVGNARSDRSALRLAQESQSNPFFQDLLGEVGRGDLSSLLTETANFNGLLEGGGLQQPNITADVQQASTQANSVVSALREQGDRLSNELRSLATEIRTLATMPSSLTVERADDVGFLQQAMQEFGKSRLRAAGIG